SFPTRRSSDLIQAIGRPFFENLFSSFLRVGINVTLSQLSADSLTVSKENLNQHFFHINLLLVYFAIFECFNAIFLHFYVYGVSSSTIYPNLFQYHFVRSLEMSVIFRHL